MKPVPIGLRTLERCMLALFCSFSLGIAHAQPCLTGWNVTTSTPPVNGTYACGQTVTFCLNVTSWNQTNANWFHGVVATWGPGWDLSTLTPSPPPATCGTSTGTWGWYNSVQGTSFFTNIGPQGPGFFFDLNNDGNAGNNFGDNCTGPWQFCWTISVLDGPACVNGTSLSVSFNTFGDSETGSWSGSGCTGDPNLPGPPAVIASCAVDAGTDGALNVCDTSGPEVLFAYLGGTPDGGGTWTGPGGAASTGIFVPGIDVPGAYTYTVSSAAPPCSASAVVTVSAAAQPDAGQDATLTSCASDPPTDLLGVLAGTPDPGGAWTRPDGTPFGGTFDPGVDPAGTYTYAFAPGAPCQAVSAVVTVVVNPTPDPGEDALVTVCSTDAAIDLFTLLGGNPDIGGIWTAPDGSPFDGTYTPDVDIPGDHTYSVDGTAPCPGSSAVVTVVENTQPDAGQNGVVAACSTDAPLDLLSFLEGSPAPGGSWSDPSGLPMGGSLDPGTAVSGTYTYTIIAPAGCQDVSAEVAATISPAPDPGLAASVTVCSNGPAIDLFDELNGDPDAGGTWTAPDGSATTGTYSPLTNPPGAYVYSVAGIPPCAAGTATVTVLAEMAPSAGTDTAIDLCQTSATVDLLTVMEGTPDAGGTWTAPDASPTSGLLDPATAASGTYTYTVSATAPCQDATASVEVTIQEQPTAGSDGSMFLCTSSDPVLLSTGLGGTPDGGGTWSGPNGAEDGTFTPGVDAAGTYIYTVPAQAPCLAASAEVQVSVGDQPDAGTDGTVALCSAPSIPFDLFSGLGGSADAGGTWTAPDGTAHGPTFEPGTDAPGTYTYTLVAAAPCTTATSTLEVTVTEAANAGTGTAVDLCEDEALVDPQTWLGGTPDIGGLWTGPDGEPVAFVDPSSSPAGNYTYTVAGTLPCPDVQAVVAVTITELPQAGTDGILAGCSDGAPTDLFGLLGGDAQSGGTWTGPDGAFSGTFIPGSSSSGTYSYVVDGSAGCPGRSDTAVVSVTVFPLPEPSFTVGPAEGCAPLTVELVNTTTSALQVVSWDLGDGSGSSAQMGLSHVYTSGGSYDVTLTVTDPNGCTGTLTQEDAVFISEGPSASFSASPFELSQTRPVIDVVHFPVDGVNY